MNIFKSLSFTLTSCMLALAGVVSTSTVSAKTLSKSDYRSEETSEIVRKGLEEKTLVKISFENPYHRYGEKPIYRAYEKYYEQFTYQWKDPNGNIVTSKITERATDRNQIIALLTEIYTNPDIPGYVEDISYLKDNDVDYDNNYRDTEKYEEIQGINKIEVNGEYFVWTTSEDGFYGNEKKKMPRSEYNVINYPAQDFYPFFIKEAPKPPINGATALLVEMKASYYKENRKNDEITYPYPNPLGGLHPGKLRAEIDNAIDFIDAVTLITKERYLDESGGTDNETTENPGFMFNIEGYFAKCFIITKGSPRPDKAIGHYTWYSEAQEHKEYNYVRDENGELFIDYGGKPFFDMFEEFSPTNNGPMANAFAQMDGGKAFYVDHNCSSVTMQQHDIIMGGINTYEERNMKYHINLMFFLPDYRFNSNTSLKPSDRWNPNGEITDKYLYAPYTFYAEKHRPYFFFNKIKAEIDDAVTIHDETVSDGRTRQYAHVPVLWVSNYKDIIDQKVPESFWIYRVIDGKVDEEPIPLTDILIRQTGNKQEDIPFIEGQTQVLNDLTWYYKAEHNKGYINAGDNDGALIRASSNTVTVYVKEEYDKSKDGGRAVSYVIQGRRKDSVFNFVESNVVTAVLPYSSADGFMTLKLHRAESNYDIDQQKNVYGNIIDYVYVKQEVNATPGMNVGNLLVQDLFLHSNGKNILRPGYFNIYRSLTNTFGDTKNTKLLYKLRFDEKAIINVGTTGVVRLVEDNVMKFIDSHKGIMGTNELDPFRTLDNLRKNGLTDGDAHVDVKVAMVFKINDLTGDKAISYLGVPWVALDGTGTGDGNNGLMGYFIDNEDFSDTTHDNNIQEHYYYYVEFVPDENATALDDEIAEVAEERLISNIVDVRVPLRPLTAAYLPYTYEQIEAEALKTFGSDVDMYDEGNLLPPNEKGVLMNVSNSALIKNYDIYRLPRKGEEEKGNVLVARVWRNQDGSFQPRVFDGTSSSDDSAQDGGERTHPNFVGRVPVRLIAETVPGDKFAVIINTVNNSDEPYRDNTYGAMFTYLPEYPTVSITNTTIRQDNDDKTKYYAYIKAQADVKSISGAPVAASDVYDGFFYGLWTYDFGKYTDIGNPFPAGAIFDAKDHWTKPKDIEEYAMFEDAGNVKDLDYEFINTEADPSKGEMVVTTNVVRLYARVAPDYSTNKDEDQYVVTDAVAHYGLKKDGSTTGVEDVEVDEALPYRYFNLQGVEVRGDNLAPGVYIRTNGLTTEKIRIK